MALKTADDGQSPQALVTKWSLKTTPPSDDAVRVRNNQRRHRERVKTHIANLEARVKMLEGELDTANARIGDLTREVETYRHERRSRPPQESQPSQASSTVSPSVLRPTQPTLPLADVPSERSSERFCCRRPDVGGTSDGADVSDREDLPAAEEGESTTNCETAYRMLKQQSAGALDPETAEQFLRPGYRRASRQGDGCRVQTKLVYGLLDHITP